MFIQKTTPHFPEWTACIPSSTSAYEDFPCARAVEYGHYRAAASKGETHFQLSPSTPEAPRWCKPGAWQSGMEHQRTLRPQSAGSTLWKSGSTYPRIHIYPTVIYTFRSILVTSINGVVAVESVCFRFSLSVPHIVLESTVSDHLVFFAVSHDVIESINYSTQQSTEGIYETRLFKNQHLIFRNGLKLTRLALWYTDSIKPRPQRERHTLSGGVNRGPVSQGWSIRAPS